MEAVHFLDGKSNRTEKIEAISHLEKKQAHRRGHHQKQEIGEELVRRLHQGKWRLPYCIPRAGTGRFLRRTADPQVEGLRFGALQLLFAQEPGSEHPAEDPFLTRLEGLETGGGG